MTKDSAQFWLDILRSGDRQGIARMYEQFLPRIEKLVTSNSGTSDDARDIFQEAIIVIYKKVSNENLTLSASFFTYLYAVCRNLWLKKLQKRGKMMVTNDEPTEQMDVSDWESVMQEEGRYRLFRSKFNELSDNCRQLLGLFFKKTSMQEIVSIMGFGSVAYAKKRKFQCKEKLVALVKNDPGFKNLLP